MQVETLEFRLSRALLHMKGVFRRNASLFEANAVADFSDEERLEDDDRITLESVDRQSLQRLWMRLR
jgi:hypothetical protein